MDPGDHIRKIQLRLLQIQFGLKSVRPADIRFARQSRVRRFDNPMRHFQLRVAGTPRCPEFQVHTRIVVPPCEIPSMDALQANRSINSPRAGPAIIAYWVDLHGKFRVKQTPQSVIGSARQACGVRQRRAVPAQPKARRLQARRRPAYRSSQTQCAGSLQYDCGTHGMSLQIERPPPRALQIQIARYVHQRKRKFVRASLEIDPSRAYLDLRNPFLRVRIARRLRQSLLA